MAYVSIPDAKRAVGKPVTKDLVDNIHSNLEDLNTRLASISLAAGSNVLLNQLHKKPKDSLPIGSIIFGSLTAAQFTAETEGGEWVAADGATVSGSDWSTLTGRTVLPDIRGRFIRAKSNASGNSPLDPALDAYTADTVVSHQHDMSHGHGHSISASNAAAPDHFHELASNSTGGTASNPTLQPYSPIAPSYHYLLSLKTAGAAPDYSLIGSVNPPNVGISGFAGGHTHAITIAGGVTNMAGNTGLTGSSETAPRYVTENVFIKINRAYVNTDTRLFAIRVLQQTTINNILLSPVSQGTSGNLVIDIKKGSSPLTASQSIFQSGQLPTLAWNGTTGVTGLTDSNQNTVAAGQFIVVSITSTQAKLKEFHLSISGDY